MDSAITMIERPFTTRRRRKVRAVRGWQFPLRGILTFTAAISGLLGILRLINVDGAMVATGFLLFAAVALTGVALVELSWHLQGGPANVARWRRTRQPPVWRRDKPLHLGQLLPPCTARQRLPAGQALPWRGATGG